MKKATFILIATFALGAIFTGVPAMAQQSWTLPIPIGSDLTQAGPNRIKTNAIDVKFFNHPPATGNYATTAVDVTAPDGSVTSVEIDDVIATPGLYPGTRVRGGELSELLDEMLPETFGGVVVPPPAVSPTHDFCPPPTTYTSMVFGAPVTSTVYFECDATKPSGMHLANDSSRQVEVSDILKGDAAEFRTITDLAPLDPMQNIVGDARESMPPYDSKSYLATIKSQSPLGDYTYTWTSGSGVAISTVTLEQPYSQVIAYGLTNVTEDGGKGGAVTTAYDPLYVEKKIMATSIKSDGTILRRSYLDPASPSTSDGKLYRAFLRRHISPLIFFRNAIDKGKMLLSAYSSWHMGRVDFGKFDQVLTGFLNLFLSMNHNPITVENLENGKYLAVVNQGTIGDIERAYLNSMGLAHVFTDGNKHKWRELLLDDSSLTLPETGGPGDAYFPVYADNNGTPVSPVIFWEKQHNWTHDAADTDKPNEIYDPKLLALVAPGMFDSGVVTDAGKQFLIVGSAAKAKDGSIYIYKTSPNGGPLYLDGPKFGPAIPKTKIGVIAEPYAVIPPEGGYVPYGVETGDFNGDGYGDIVLTWRGAETIWSPPPLPAALPLPFTNHYADEGANRINYVHFKKTGPDELEMFSKCVTIYYGDPGIVAGKSVYSEAMKNQICMTATAEEAKWQIASVAVGDLDEDGKDDLLVGNLNPKKITEGPDAGKYTGYAAYFKNADLQLASISIPTQYVRLGFNSVATGPPPSDEGMYLLEAWNGTADRLAGVSSMDISKSNIVSKDGGMPLMLPPFGCPAFTSAPIDTDVESPWELMWSMLYNKNEPGVSWQDGNIVPMRCVRPEIMPPPPTIMGLPEEPTLEHMTPPLIIEPSPEHPTLVPLSPEGGAIHTPKDKMFSEDSGSGSSDNGGSDFARCDKVYDSKAPYIATASQLKYAAEMTYITEKPAFSKDDFIELLMLFGFSNVEANKAYEDMTKNSNKFKPILDTLVYPALEMMFRQIDMTPPREPNASLVKPEMKSGGFSLIKEAYANPESSPDGVYISPCPPGVEFCSSNFRLPRGQIMPGKNELTVALKNFTPPPPEIPSDCPTCCPDCCEPTCETCERDTKAITIKCIAPEGAAKYINKFNESMCAAVPGLINSQGVCNASFCLWGEGVMEAEITSPGGAAPNAQPGDLNSMSLSTDIIGNIGKFAFAQSKGTKPFDFTIQDKLPLKVDNVTKTMILLPAAPTAGGGRAMTVSPDLMASASSVEPTLLSDYMEASADPSLGVPSVGFTASENTFTFNNVISLQTKAAAATKASGLMGSAVTIAKTSLQQPLCSWSARCEGSDIEKEENQLKVSPAEILKRARENASMCSNGVCPAEFFVKLGIPEYQSYGFILVNGKVAKAGEAVETPDTTPYGYGGIPAEFGRGGGCNCDITALSPDAASVIAMILVASVATTGFIVVRVRAKKK